MEEILNDLINYSVEGVVRIDVAKDLIQRAYNAGYLEGGKAATDICVKLIKQ